LTASVPYSVLELALSLTFQHRPQDAIGWLGLTDDVVGGQKVQHLPRRDAAVLIVAQRIGAVFPLRDAQAVRQQVVAAPHGDQHRGNAQFHVSEPHLVHFGPQPGENLPSLDGFHQAVLDGQAVHHGRSIVV